MSGGGLAIELDELRRAVAAADPSAILVPDRILRRVIRQDRRLRWLGGSHPKCYAIAGTALGAIVDAPELGRPSDSAWPAMALLIAQHGPDELIGTDRGPILTEAWRRLFQLRVACEVSRSIESGAIDASGLDARMEAIGRAEFDEARTVLRQDGVLLSPESDASAYAAFAAVFLDLTFFATADRSSVFPAIESVGAVEAILAGDVDGKALLAATRPAGAPGPSPAAGGSDRQPDPDSGTGSYREPASGRIAAGGPVPKAAARARVASERGNDVRAAILWTRSARRAGSVEVQSGRAAARAALNRLAVRLRKALFVQKGESSLWVGALTPLLEDAAGGFWTPERRLLHDLQNVCLDHEREVFRLEPLGWLFSMGRRPLKHPLPHLREVTMSKHLRSASRRLGRARLDRDQRARLEGLLHAAGRRAEDALRERFRTRVDATLRETWVRPANLPERVAYRKLVEEMLDPIVARGFTTLGDLRDSASRGDLKLSDVASAGEFLRGDRLLRSDHELARALDGVHHRGEVYLRWLQRFSALAFGTPVGRFLTLFLALPFGGSFVLLKGLEEIDELAIARFTHVHAHLVNAPSILLLGTLALGVINFARFRRRFLGLMGTFGRTVRAVLVDLPARVLHHPLVRRLAASVPARVAWRFAIKPGLAAAPVWVLARMRLGPSTAAAVGLASFLAASLMFNTRAGRRFEEWLNETIARAGRGLIFAVIPGLFHLIMSAFDRLIEWVEKVIYAVDEWLRFREGQSRVVLALKAVLGLFWGVVAYAARIYLVLLVEPQLNPIKHFPVVTVAAKIILPFVEQLQHLFAAPMKPILGTWIANAFAAPTVFFLPGLFGFLVWELRSNWRLYEANRPPALGPLAVGSHGETVVRFLRPAFHSGTLPKRFAKLRRALRAGSDRTAAKHREALHHVEEAMRRLVERDFAGLLAQSRALASWSIEPGSIHLATNRIRIELVAREGDRPGLWIDLEECSGSLTAGIFRTGWVDSLDAGQRRVLGDALAGLYKLAGVERIQSPGDRRPDPAAGPACAGQSGTAPGPADFTAVVIPWREWVAEWDAEASRGIEAVDHEWRAGLLPAIAPAPGLASTR